MMPGDNAAPVAIDAPVLYPQDGPTSGAVIRAAVLGDRTFQIVADGTYLISWQASVDEPGKLALWLDPTGTGGAFVKNLESQVGRATGTNHIVGSKMLVLSAGTLVQLRNGDSPAAITLTPSAGGAGGSGSVNATLTFLRLA